MSAEQFMKIAIECAKKSVAEDAGLHPQVGAVLVRGEKQIGSGYRGATGAGDHAEYVILGEKSPLAGQDLRDAVLYTTLEPCTKRKKHKPCSQWIIERAIGTVIIGILDPNPQIYSKGAVLLRSNGIKVGYFPQSLREQIEADNRRFIDQFRASPSLEGSARFDYTANNGIYTIGHGERVFETMWTQRGEDSVYCYRDRISAVAIAADRMSIIEVVDASVYDASSRYRFPSVGQVVVLKNTNGYWAALRIDKVDARHNELSFSYRILQDKSSNFAGTSAL